MGSEVEAMEPYLKVAARLTAVADQVRDRDPIRARQLEVMADQWRRDGESLAMQTQMPMQDHHELCMCLECLG